MAAEAGGQAGYAVVAAAFVTGIWAWLSQRAKAKDDNVKDEKIAERSDSQNLLQSYKEFNEQLQNRISILTNEISSLWANLNLLQATLKDSETFRNESARQIVDLETQVKELKRRTDEYETSNKHLESENTRLYRLLIERNIDTRRGGDT